MNTSKEELDLLVDSLTQRLRLRGPAVDGHWPSHSESPDEPGTARVEVKAALLADRDLPILTHVDDQGEPTALPTEPYLGLIKLIDLVKWGYCRVPPTRLAGLELILLTLGFGHPSRQQVIERIIEVQYNLTNISSPVDWLDSIWSDDIATSQLIPKTKIARSLVELPAEYDPDDSDDDEHNPRASYQIRKISLNSKDKLIVATHIR